MCTVTILPLRLTGSKAVELMEVELPNMPLDLFCWLLSTLINETRVREQDDGSTSNTWVIRIAKFIIQGSNEGHLHSHGQTKTAMEISDKTGTASMYVTRHLGLGKMLFMLDKRITWMRRQTKVEKREKQSGAIIHSLIVQCW